jgi:peroxiredoxin
MTQFIPSYIELSKQIKEKGADEIIALSVNDPFVMAAFGEYLNGKDLINFIADGNGEFTKALGFDMDLTAV